MKRIKLAAAAFLLGIVFTWGVGNALPAIMERWLSRIDNYRDICIHEAYAIITYQPYRNVLLLDVRSAEEFNGGYIAGAINIEWTALEANLSDPAHCPLIGHETDEIIVYCQTGGRSANASEVLATHGFQMVYNMVGGIEAWTYAAWNYPLVTEAPPTYIDIGVHEAYNMITDDVTYPDLVVVDVQSSEDYDQAHIETAINIPYYDDSDFGTKLDPLVGHENDEIIVYCLNEACSRGPNAAQYLVNHGFTKVYHTVGGIEAWIAAGYPVVGSQLYHIRLSTSEGGSTDPAPGVYYYNQGASVTLTAVAETGYVFDHWESAVSGNYYSSSNPWNFNMPNYSFTIRAVFTVSP